jgi:type II secretory pathway pseudopilin PulG
MSARRRPADPHGAGHTLFELALVLGILAVLAAVALPRLPRPDIAEADYGIALQALRAARRAAIASACPVQVTLDATGIGVHHATDAAAHCPPAGTPLAGLARDWPRANTRPTRTLRFDADGRSDGAHRLVLGAGPALRIAADTGHVERE